MLVPGRAMLALCPAHWRALLLSCASSQPLAAVTGRPRRHARRRAPALRPGRRRPPLPARSGPRPRRSLLWGDGRAGARRWRTRTCRQRARPRGAWTTGRRWRRGPAPPARPAQGPVARPASASVHEGSCLRAPAARARLRAQQGGPRRLLKFPAARTAWLLFHVISILWLTDVLQFEKTCCADGGAGEPALFRNILL